MFFPHLISLKQQAILATLVQFGPGYGFYKRSWNVLRHKSVSMDVLVVLGTTAAYGLSLYLLTKSHHHVYFESACVVITLVLFGKYLEKMAKKKTLESIKSLEKIRPEKATILIHNIEQIISVHSIRPEDILVLKPGERIACDGEVIQGESEVDQSALTGESMPVHKNISDKVFSGTVNGSGYLYIRVVKVGDQTLLGNIIRLVEEAQAYKAPIQKLVDKISFYFVPSIILFAVITFFLNYIFQSGFENSLIRSISVLVMACPCALGLATPIALMVGVGIGAKKGLLIKEGEALELSRKISLFAFDKTGTLTFGAPSVKTVESFILPKFEFERISASLSSKSEHILSRAICSSFKGNYLPLDKFSNLPGKGIKGVINNKEWMLGNLALLKENNIDTSKLDFVLKSSNELGYSISFLASDKVEGYFLFQDKVRSQAKTLIQNLKDKKIKTVLLTGDNEGAAKLLSEELGLDDYYANLLPQEKSQKIKDFKDNGFIVAMAGDGINDALSLNSSDVSFSMGSGSDVAIHSSDVTLMHANLLLFSTMIDLSKMTFNKVRQNLFWAFFFNIIGLPLAALGFLNPMLAGTAMALSSFMVVSNTFKLPD
jgi:Cu+-exporting ATPase